MKVSTRRAGGRSARHRKRSQTSGGLAVPPGMPGGWYRPLNDSQVKRIHEASLDILERIGIAGATEAWNTRVVEAGGSLDGDGRLHFPRAMVEDAIAKAGRDFVLHGRDPAHDLDMSGTRVHLGGSSGTVQILDVETDRYRESNLLDVYDTARLEDSLDHMHFVVRSCVACDLTDPEVLDLNTAYAVMSGTTKHMISSFFKPHHLEKALQMFDLSLGGDGSGAEFRKRPFASVISTFVVPPLRFVQGACDVMDAAVRHGMPVVAISCGQTGATAPASLAGALLQGNAEALSAIVALNLLKPGHPVLFANWPFVTDLRTGAYAGGGGENALLAAGAAEMANFYDLPSSVGVGITSSKTPDVQAGWEKGYLTTLPALAGANMIFESAGVLADIIAFSQEAMMVDGDMLGGVLRALRGIEVDDDRLSVPVIEEVVAGPGHFLGHPQTLRLMETEYVYPRLADRRTIDEWEKAGDKDIRLRTKDRLREVMGRYYPDHVDQEADARIRNRFDIRLARQDMRPGNGRW